MLLFLIEYFFVLIVTKKDILFEFNLESFNMKYIAFILLLQVGFVCSTYAQFLSGKNAQVLIKGVTFDENTNQPIGVSIEFKSADGKKIKTQSNINSGLFEQLLPAGENYTVILSSDNILRKEFSFKVDVTDKFKEQKTEWSVLVPVVGAKIFAGNIFKKGTSSISDDGAQKLKELQMLLRFNRSLYVSFNIESENESLSKDRVNELNTLLDTWMREKTRVELKSIKKTAKNETVKDLYVHITKIEEFLNK